MDSPITNKLIQNTVFDLILNNPGQSRKNFFKREVITRVLIIVGTPFTLLCDTFLLVGTATYKLALYPLRKCCGKGQNQTIKSIFEQYAYGVKNLVSIPIEPVRRAISPKSHLVNDTVFKRTDKKAIDQLYQTFSDMHTLFEKHGIWYSMHAGTYLGAQRNKGIIPWDDDGDVFVLDEDLTKIRALKEELSQLGYDIFDCKHGWPKIAPKSAKRADGTYFPEVDLFPIKKVGEKWINAVDDAAKFWPNDYLTDSEKNNLKLWDFGKIKLWGPVKHDAFLSRMYGKDWNEIAYQIWDHENNMFSLEKRKVFIVTRTPA